MSAAKPGRAMITLDAGGIRFTYRVVAVALHNGRVLIHRAETDDFWALPGGRAELGETAHDTLRREMREELGQEVDVERLLWVAETFFGHAGRRCHELGLYFLITFRDPAIYRHDAPFCGDEGGLRLIFTWQPLAQLDATRLYPTFLRERLRDLPLATDHIVHHDPED